MIRFCRLPSLLFVTILLFYLSAASAGESSVLTVRQGEVIPLTLAAGTSTRLVSGTFENRILPFYKRAAGTGDNLFTALIGIDLAHPTGVYPLEIATGVHYKIEVVPANFGVQTLTLPEDKVDLDPKTLARVEQEAERFKTIFNQSPEKRLWERPFLVPVTGEISGEFGRRRIINGQEKNPHTGVDIAAPMGTPVLASNAGKIILTGDFFFNGRSIVMDHGEGVITMYFHLSEIAVRDGMTVQRGDVIGLVGQSGRATGPHLHWGARVHGARVDPFSLVSATR